MVLLNSDMNWLVFLIMVLFRVLLFMVILIFSCFVIFVFISFLKIVVDWFISSFIMCLYCCCILLFCVLFVLYVLVMVMVFGLMGCVELCLSVFVNSIMWFFFGVLVGSIVVIWFVSYVKFVFCWWVRFVWYKVLMVVVWLFCVWVFVSIFSYGMVLFGFSCV